LVLAFSSAISFFLALLSFSFPPFAALEPNVCSGSDDGGGKRETREGDEASRAESAARAEAGARRALFINIDCRAICGPDGKAAEETAAG